MHHRRSCGIADLVHFRSGQGCLLLPDVFARLEDDALHYDDRTINDDAEVDGSQTHQVGPYAKDAHEDKGDQQ